MKTQNYIWFFSFYLDGTEQSPSSHTCIHQLFFGSYKWILSTPFTFNIQIKNPIRILYFLVHRIKNVPNRRNLDRIKCDIFSTPFRWPFSFKTFGMDYYNNHPIFRSDLLLFLLPYIYPIQFLSFNDQNHFIWLEKTQWLLLKESLLDISCTIDFLFQYNGHFLF